MRPPSEADRIEKAESSSLANEEETRQELRTRKRTGPARTAKTRPIREMAMVADDWAGVGSDEGTILPFSGAVLVAPGEGSGISITSQLPMAIAERESN